MACKFIVNGQESELYNKILEAYNGDGDSAQILHSYFKNDKEFIKNFGDWEEDYKSDIKDTDYSYNKETSRIEDNGEPKLFKNELNGNYYYIDKDKNKEEVIWNTKTLNSLFSNSEVSRLIKVLGDNYIKNNLKLDFENIEIEGESITLKQSITEKLNSKIKEFKDTGDYLWEDRADSLQTSLDTMYDEIFKKVKDYIESYKIKYSEKENVNLDDNESEANEIQENEKDSGFGIASNERSTKQNTTANVKARLSLIEDTLEKDYFMNDTVYKSFDEIYASLLPNLTNRIALVVDGQQEDLFELMKEQVAKLVNKKPYFKELYRILSKDDLSDDIKSEFTQAFNLDLQSYNTSITKTESVDGDTKIITDEDGVTRTVTDTSIVTSHDVKNIADVGKKEVEVFSEWSKNFKDKFITLNETKQLILPKESRNKISAIKTEVNKISFGQENNIQAVVKVLRDLGIESTEKGFEHFLDNLQLINKDNEVNKKQFNTLLTGIKYFINNVLDNKNTNYTNILNDQTVLKNLARAEAFYISEGSDSSVYTAGKQKWTYSYPSYLSTTIKTWKKDRNELYKHYKISLFNEGSDYMEYLLALGDTYQVNEFLPQPVQETERIEESKKRIDAIDLASFNTVQEDENSVEGMDNKSIDRATYISDTINKVLGFTKGKGYKSYHRTTTPADKGTQYELTIGRNISTNARRNENGDIDINTEAVKIVFKYYNAEYKRMKYEREFMNDANNQSKLSTYYHLGAGHAFKSQLFPSLSHNKIREEMKKLSAEDRFDAIYDGDTPTINDLEGSLFEDRVMKYIAKELSKNIDKTLKSLIKQGVFKTGFGEVHNVSLDSSIWDSYGSENALKASADFYINSIMSHIEYSKMFAGDIAYYKNGVDYKKRVPATYTDGLQQRLNDVNKEYTIAVTQSINISSPFHQEIQDLVGEEIASYYGDNNINSADAQAWITPERWRDIFKSLGKWNNIYQSAYDKMMGINNEPFTLEELKKVAPPVKGVYFQIVNGKPVFLKYSQAILSPRLRAGNGLEKLYKQMVKQSVDELVTFDAIKVGSNMPVKVHDNKGNVLDDITFNPMKIPSNGWKLQQDLPVKGFHDTELGSQIQKNIFQGLAFNLDKAFEFAGNEVTGNDMIEHISNLVGNLSDRGYNKVLNEFGIGDDGIITNISGFYKSIISELKDRGGSNNVIKALESETSIYGIPQAQSKLQNIFASIMNKRILKIKTNGGSFVQMSNFGLNKENAEAQGVLWNPNALSTTHEPQYLKDEREDYILSENGKKIIRPGGILISGSFIAKYIPDYRKYTSEELFIDYKGQGPIIDKKILENIIGYRIPNQGLSSNDALEIVGILPEENGDTVVAYTGITTKTGSDFDIDKMYMMFPTYNLEGDKLVYEPYDENKPLEEQSLGAVQNRLIEAYKAVILNENVIGDVMTPIDFDHMKNDIRSMHKQAAQTNLSLFDPLTDIDVKYSFLAGKAGVGQEANALMDYVLGSMANLDITNFDILKGNDSLDEEYSQPLNQQDLDYYQKQLNLSKEQVDKLKSIKISHSLSAILNAFVDIAKDPYITEGNWVTMTTNTGNLLLRKGVHPFYVNAFLSQPIIGEYIEFSEQYEQSDDQPLSTAEAFKIEYFGEGFEYNKPFENVLDHSLETLRDNLKQKGSILSSQAHVFDTFLELQKASKAIKNNIDSSKFMVNGIGKNVTSLNIAKNLVDATLSAEQKYNDLVKYGNPGELESFKKNIILGFSSKFSNPNGSESMFSRYYKNIILGTERIVRANPKLFLSANETVQDTFNEISHAINGEILTDQDLGTQLEKDFYSYIMSGFTPLKVSIDERRDLLLNFPKEFSQFKEDYKTIYPIIDQLVIKTGETMDFIALNNRKKSREFEEGLVNSFTDLINNEPGFADKLIKYSYLTSGFAINMNQFFTQIPTEWFSRNKINRYIIDLSNDFTNSESNIDTFIDQFFLSNLENRKIVKGISPKNIDMTNKLHELGKGFVAKKSGKANYFVVRKTENGDIYYKLIGYTGELKGVYSRFIPNVNGDYVDVRNLNIKDKKGNRIINFNTDGLVLKLTTGLDSLVDKNYIKELNKVATQTRDYFYDNNKPEQIDNEIITEKTVNVKFYEGKIKPEVNTVFVFGSNPEGRHGAGAAKIAKDQFGAIYGQGEGLQGNSYALPTKDLRIKENKGFKSISNIQIIENIKKLYKIAEENPNKDFKIAYRNTIEISLNGYTGLEMIEMFKNAGTIPSNIIFSKEWFDTGLITSETQLNLFDLTDEERKTIEFQKKNCK